jgi:hypothetical protein
MPGSYRVPRSKRHESISRSSLVEEMSELISLRERVAQAELAAPDPFNSFNEKVPADGRRNNKRSAREPRHEPN